MTGSVEVVLAVMTGSVEVVLVGINSAVSFDSVIDWVEVEFEVGSVEVEFVSIVWIVIGSTLVEFSMLVELDCGLLFTSSINPSKENSSA